MLQLHYFIMELEMIKSGDLLLDSSDMRSFPLSHFNSVSIWQWCHVFVLRTLAIQHILWQRSLSQLPYNNFSAPGVSSYQFPISKNELSHVFNIWDCVEYHNTIESKILERFLILPLLSQPWWTKMISSVIANRHHFLRGQQLPVIFYLWLAMLTFCVT